MKRIACFLLFMISLSPILCYSESNPEQILNQIKKCPESQQDSLYYEIYVYYKYNNPDSALYFANKVYSLSQKFEHKKIYVKSLHALGFLASDKGDYNQANQYYKKGLDIAQKINYHIGILMMINDLGWLNSNKEQYDISLEYYLKEIEYAIKFKQPWDEAIAYNNMATVYQILGNHRDALKNFLNCIRIKNDNGIVYGLEINYCNVGLCYIDLKKYIEAAKIYTYVIDKFPKRDLRISSFCSYGIGLSLLYLNKLDSAKLLLNKALIKAKKASDNYRIFSIYNSEAKIYYNEKNYDTTKMYLDSANDILVKLHDRRSYISILNYYSKVYQKTENYKEALIYKNKMVELKDSIFNADQSRNIINDLIDFHELQNKQELQEKETKLERNRQFAFFSSTGIILLIIILFFSYRALALRKQLTHRLDDMVSIKTRELSETNNMLVRSRNELDTFLYRTSHDIRGPIATLMGLNGIARIDGPGKITEQWLEQMDFTTNKVNEIITRLTNVSLINSQVAEFCELNASNIAHEVVDKIRKNLAVVPEIDFIFNGDMTLKINSDRILFYTILNNLLENAFKFYDHREDNPKVELQIVKNGRLDLDFIDNGIGIDPSVHDKIFGIFSTASEIRGAGLGLYQARLAAKKLGGSITLVTLKKPTNFHVTLPLI